MTSNLISAEEARNNASNYDLSADQIVSKIAHSIEANSLLGKTSIGTSFLKKAASSEEIEKALSELHGRGYAAKVDEGNSDDTKVRLVVEW